MYNYDIIHICKSEKGACSQYLGILKPCFLSGRGEKNQLKVLQPAILDTWLTLLRSEADLLAFQQGRYGGFGLCSDPLGVLFLLCGEVYLYLKIKVVGYGEHKQ